MTTEERIALVKELLGPRADLLESVEDDYSTGFFFVNLYGDNQRVLDAYKALQPDMAAGERPPAWWVHYIEQTGRRSTIATLRITLDDFDRLAVVRTGQA